MQNSIIDVCLNDFVSRKHPSSFKTAKHNGARMCERCTQYDNLIAL